MFFIYLLLNVLMDGTAGKQNFLLIIVDDLRTTLGCYGDAKAYTPEIDSLAEKSVVFSRAFAQQALCAPSRNSFLTSRRPDTLELYDFYSYWRDVAGNYTTLPQHLKNNGYTTMSIGKVFHPGISSNGSDDSPYSWTEKPFHPYTDRYKNAPVCQANKKSPAAKNLVCPVHVLSMPNKTLPDFETLNTAVSFIQQHRKDTKPFFLAVGFQKPHVPLKYPKKYTKYHPIEKFEIPNPYVWSNISSVAYNPWTDLREREDVKALNLEFPWEKIPPSFGVRIIQSYYAAVSYIDNLIGTLINELDVSGIRDNTVIILTSDHGWSLGEHAEWSKYSNFDVATRVPFMISIPGLTFERNRNKNHRTSCHAENKIEKGIYKTTDALVELVDLFPTIADIAGVPIPMCPNLDDRHAKGQTIDELPNPCSEGITFLPLVEIVGQNKTILWKKAAFSQYPRPGVTPTLNPNSDKPRLKEIRVMGYTLRSHKYRYTAWLPFSWKTKKPNWKNIIAEELYDHTIDPAENLNLANSQEIRIIKRKLKGLLRCGWRCALPIN